MKEDDDSSDDGCIFVLSDDEEEVKENSDENANNNAQDGNEVMLDHFNNESDNNNVNTDSDDEESAADDSDNNSGDGSDDSSEESSDDISDESVDASVNELSSDSDESSDSDNSCSDKDNEHSNKQEKKWPKLSILTKKMEVEELIRDIRQNWLNFMLLVRNILQNNLTMEDMIVLLGKIYDWEWHLEIIDTILVIQDTNEQEKEKETYIYEWHCIYFETWIDSWNESYSKYEDMVYEKEDLLLQFALIKSRIYFFRENGMFQESFEESKKIFKSEYNIKITMHNEIGRLLLKCKKFHADCASFVCQWTHAEAMGASEGRVEGDVKAGANIIRNRYRLSTIMFGYEFPTQDCLRSHPHLENKVNKIAAKKLYKIKGSPFYKKAKYWPSKPLWKRLNKTRLKNLSKNTKLQSKQFPSINAIKTKMKRRNGNINVSNDFSIPPPAKKQRLLLKSKNVTCNVDNVSDNDSRDDNCNNNCNDDDEDDEDDDQDVIDDMEAMLSETKR